MIIQVLSGYKSKMKLTSILIFLIIAFSIVNAQTSYIYVHRSTVDESSNPTSGTGTTSGFNFELSGGTTIVSPFVLNNALVYTAINDIGAASTSKLFVATAGVGTIRSFTIVQALDRV